MENFIVLSSFYHNLINHVILEIVYFVYFMLCAMYVMATGAQ